MSSGTPPEGAETAPEGAAPAQELREALSPAEEAFERRRQSVGLLAAPLVFVALLLAPLPGLTPEAHRLAAVLMACVTLWLTEAIPLAVTGLLGVALAVLLGVDSAKEALLPFSDHLVFLLIGGFILAEAIFAHGLNRRFAFGVLSLPWVGANPRRLLVAYTSITAAISMWVSNTATTALMLPVGLSVLAFLRRAERQRGAGDAPTGAATESAAPGGGSAFRAYATALMLATAFGASLGGLGTPVGSPTNLIGLGFLKEATGTSVTFFQWMALAVPIMVLLLGWTLWTLQRGGAPLPREIPGGRDFLLREKSALGRITRGEINVLAIFGGTVVLWLLPGVLALFGGMGAGTPARLFSERLPEGLVAIFGASALFLVPISLRERRFTLTWAEARRIDWGAILLLASGMALGRLCDRTGLARAVGEGLAAGLPADAPVLLLAMSTLAAVIISEATSNMASATMLVPLVISIARGAGIDPTLPALGATIGASLGFMLPVSTAPNAMAYGTGLVPISRMVRYGILLDVAGVVVVTLVLALLGPLVIR